MVTNSVHDKIPQDTNSQTVFKNKISSALTKHKSDVNIVLTRYRNEKRNHRIVRGCRDLLRQRSARRVIMAATVVGTAVVGEAVVGGHQLSSAVSSPVLWLLRIMPPPIPLRTMRRPMHRHRPMGCGGGVTPRSLITPMHRLAPPGSEPFSRSDTETETRVGNICQYQRLRRRTSLPRPWL
jgi:hypothetical protein